MITSYGSLLRMPVLAETAWRLVILDEAQAIKNPGRQADAGGQGAEGAGADRADRHAGREPAWAICGRSSTSSIPGCWARRSSSPRYTKALAERTAQPVRPAARAGAPLHPAAHEDRQEPSSPTCPTRPRSTRIAISAASRRRCTQQAVAGPGQRSLEEAEGIQRKGIVLAMLMRLKQICNHPSQWLGDGAWAEADSGKLARLREIAEVVAARQEKMLVFTQFREMTAPLAAFLGGVFGRAGPGAARRDRGEEAQGRWCGSSRTTRPCRSSCCR